MFIYNFLISNIIISLAIIILLAIKRLMGNKISPRNNCIMWLSILILIFVSFLPSFAFNFPSGGYINTITKTTALNQSFKINTNVNDLYISAKNYNFLCIFWILGIAFNTFLLILSHIKLNMALGNKIQNNIFNICSDKIGVKADLYISSKIKSPLSFGLIHPVIVIPHIDLNPTHLEHILLHELIHHKHKDIFVNYILCILSSVFWFNPIIHIALKAVKLDMEIYCDSAVIKYTNNNIEYGKTILALAEKNTQLKTANYMASYKNNIKKRIIKIAGFSNKYSKLYTRTVFLFLTVITAVFSTAINSFGYSLKNTYKKNTVTNYIDLKSYFNDYEGCFVLYDTNNNTYSVYNEEMARKRTAPNSTYKIAIAINGLENKVISPNNSTIKWDGTDNPFNEWNKDHNLNSAMKNSVNWYFQSIDNNINKKEIHNFLKKVSYGNMNMGYDRKNYWLENSLKISPLEQVEFIKNLYFNNFNFNKENINTLFNSLSLSNNIYGKTGTGMVNGKTISGWFIGVIEKNSNTYIFATRISATNNATGEAAMTITENILNNL